MQMRRRVITAGSVAALGVAIVFAAARFLPPAHPGKSVYDASCSACHEGGAHGAPRVGDVVEWAPRLARGEASLYGAALHGRASGDRHMPPRGGNPRLGDSEVKSAVDYMVARSR